MSTPREARVTQLASLVDDALASAKASIAASKALNEKITSTVRSAGPKAAAELKVIQAIVARVNAAEAQLNAKTGPIAREVGGAQAKIDVQKLETEVAEALIRKFSYDRRDVVLDLPGFLSQRLRYTLYPLLPFAKREAPTRRDGEC